MLLHNLFNNIRKFVDSILNILMLKNEKRKFVKYYYRKVIR